MALEGNLRAQFVPGGGMEAWQGARGRVEVLAASRVQGRHSGYVFICQWSSNVVVSLWSQDGLGANHVTQEKQGDRTM